jgi:RNA polymerase sigma-70 factor (ECF subfamily)
MDKASVKQLYDEHSLAVYKYLLQIFRSANQAEESLQEVFVRFFKHSQRHKIANIRRDLLKIAHNLCDDFMADKIRYERWLTSLDLIEETADVSDGTYWHQLRRQIVLSLQKQKDEYARVFLLKMDHNLTYPEIAYVLGVSEKKVVGYFEDIRTILLTQFGEKICVS